MIGVLAVAATVWTICPPSENAWRTYFAFRQGLVHAMIVIGSSIAILHGIYNDIKQPLGWLTTIMLDTFGLFAATRIALAIGGRASLPLSHTSLWNTPLTALGGVKPFQLVDLAGVAVLIPSMLWVMGSLMERALSCLMRISNRRRECNAADDDRHMIGVCGIKHRFSQAGAAYRVKDRKKRQCETSSGRCLASRHVSLCVGTMPMIQSRLRCQPRQRSLRMPKATKGWP